jgi:hypothetical protein
VAAGRSRGSRPQRVILPGAAELLRPAVPGLVASSGRAASGCEAHPQKITVYLSAEEYLALERARLSLRARGISADRGRLVREAIAVVLLADLDAGLDPSLVVQRLRQTADEPEPAPGAAPGAGDERGKRGQPSGGDRGAGSEHGARRGHGAAPAGPQ